MGSIDGCDDRVINPGSKLTEEGREAGHVSHGGGNEPTLHEAGGGGERTREEQVSLTDSRSNSVTLGTTQVQWARDFRLH